MIKNKTIVLTGGGSGGHLVPILSVAEVLKKEAPEYKLVYIGQKGDSLGDIMTNNPVFSAVYTVRAGKFRRYHGEGLKQILDIKTMSLNIRDFFYVCIGFVQSLILMGKIRPSVVFSRGGFVSVPVCFAAGIRRVPYITHDSDAIPSLANRIIGRWASLHAVALPKELYKYPASKTLSVGVPVAKDYKKVTPQIQLSAKNKLGISGNSPTVLIIGGGLGAERINNAVTDSAKSMFKDIPNLRILHVAGRVGEDKVRQAYEDAKIDNSKVEVFGFTDKVALLGEAADVVVTRAGATNLAEFSLQGKACIIIPNPVLTGGHQLKNAIAYRDKDAAVIVTEDHLGEIGTMVQMLLSDTQKRQSLSENIAQFANKDASLSLTKAIVSLAQKG